MGKGRAWGGWGVCAVFADMFAVLCHCRDALCLLLFLFMIYESVSTWVRVRALKHSGLGNKYSCLPVRSVVPIHMFCTY